MNGEQVEDTTQVGPPTLTRRGFLEWLIVGAGTLGGLLGLAGILAYLQPGVEGTWGAVEVAGVDEIPPGQAVAVPFRGSTALVVHLDAGFVAFTALCTHAGCLVQWDPDKGQILCPCHLGVFDAQGNVVSGLPPRPLPRLRVEQVGDRLLLAEA